MSDTIEILFFGDLVGQPGRKAVTQYLQSLSPRPHVVIANVENVTHGFGMNHQHYHELREAGIDVMTGGNHIWDHKDIFDYIHDADRLVRPHNFPGQTPGKGARVIEVNGVTIGVLSILGQAFMGNYNSPWDSVDETIADLQDVTPIVFVDMHAEATAEKKSMGYYLASQHVTAMVGTHTHVQTADDQILNNWMGYITDAGFNGDFNSVIGMDPVTAIQRGREVGPVRLNVADSGALQVNGVLFTVNAKTGQCLSVQRIQHRYAEASTLF